MPRPRERLPTASLFRRRLRATAHAQLNEILDGPTSDASAESVLGACVALATAGGITLRVSLRIETLGTR